MAGNHVRGLEKHLGARLLNRSTRRLNLTEAGGVYYERCTQVLADIQDAEAEVGVLQGSPSGLLRLAAPVTFGVLHVAPAVSDYMKRYPEVRIDVVVSDRFVNLIEEGIDLAIRIGELQDSNMIARRLASARLVVCASPDYVQRAGRPETPADFARHACLIYAEVAAPQTWRFQAQDGRNETVHVSGRSPPQTQRSCSAWRSQGMAWSLAPASRLLPILQRENCFRYYPAGNPESYRSMRFIRIDPCSEQKYAASLISSPNGSRLSQSGKGF